MNIPKIGLLIMAMFAFLLFVVSSNYMFVADTEEDNSLEQATVSAMSQGINMGKVRVNEEVTINENIVKEALVRQYVEQTNFHDGVKQLHIYAIASQPAMIATESYNTFTTPLPEYLDREEKETSVRQFTNVIYEAKQTQKPN